jgi:hypothetical protein
MVKTCVFFYVYDEDFVKLITSVYKSNQTRRRESVTEDYEYNSTAN